MTMKPIAVAALLAALALAPSMRAQSVPAEGPVGPSPYDIVRGWQQPFAGPGYAFGGNSGVFAESPDRIFIAQRGEFKLPDPVPAEFAGFAGSLKMNVLNLVEDPSMPAVKEAITGALREQREQLLRAAYVTALRNDAVVVNHFARKLVESQGKVSTATPTPGDKR